MESDWWWNWRTQREGRDRERRARLTSDGGKSFCGFLRVWLVRICHWIFVSLWAVWAVDLWEEDEVKHMSRVKKTTKSSALASFSFSIHWPQNCSNIASTQLEVRVPSWGGSTDSKLLTSTSFNSHEDWYANLSDLFLTVNIRSWGERKPLFGRDNARIPRV